jgi:hypothetical protein
VNSDSHEQQASQWSRAQLAAFRFAFAIATLSTLRASIFLPPHLVFNVLKRPTGALLGKLEEFEWRSTSAIGAFIIRTVTGGQATMKDLLLKFGNDRTLSALPDVLGLLTVALVITILWTVMDRHSANYSALNRCLRVYLRFALGGVMLTYAFIKVIPTQFGVLSPSELLRPLGQLSHFELLWDFMAASPAYTVFTGLIELTGAVLLFFRRTTLLGGLILAGALTNVVVMDLAYGIGAVTYATLLLLLNVLLLVPYLPALADILVLNKTNQLLTEPFPLRQRWYHSPVAKVVLLCVLALPLVSINLERRRSSFGVFHTVFGLFDVTAFVRNGQSVPTVASDGATWKRVARGLDNAFGYQNLSVQYADGDVRRFQLTEDVSGRLWTLRDGKSIQDATLHYDVRSDGDVSLDGHIGSDTVQIVLHPLDPNKFFPLLGG